MRVWIDLSNSPHPLLFRPIAESLEAQGHEVLITFRDNAQTLELTKARWPAAHLVGGPSPASRRAKAATIAARMNDLRKWAGATRPDVALSHNSYAQIVAAAARRIPSVTAMDFEYQPVNHLAFRLATRILLPEATPIQIARRQGATPTKVIKYPGLKEELYIGDFQPDPDILRQIGLADRPRVLVVARTPPTRAVYHGFENPLFERALQVVCSQPGVACVVLARHPEQIDAVRRLELANCIVPGKAIDSRSLIFNADAMLGAGGTMTREAALMGIRTWTLFAGTAPAVDEWLERNGRLHRLQDPEQLAALTPRQAPPRTPTQLREGAGVIAERFLYAVSAATDARSSRAGASQR